jgi:hypothetical protein
MTFRIGPGSYTLRRSDLSTEPIPVSGWKTSDATMLTLAGAIACNYIEVDRALHQSIKGNTFDFDAFGQKMRQLGLPPDLALIGPTLPPDFLDFAWNQLWHDKVVAGKRPDPSGKWNRKPTDEERAFAIKKLQDMQAQTDPVIEAAKQSLLAGIKKSQAEMAVRAVATRPDGKKLTPIESSLLVLWKGRPEEDIVKVMGNPEFNQTGDSRFLRYTKYWEKAGMSVVNTRGVVVGGEAGGYAECFVEFRTKQSSDGGWRVEDILVRSTYEDAGLGRQKMMCDDLARQASQ